MILVNKKLLIKTVTLLLFLSLLFFPIFSAFANDQLVATITGTGASAVAHTVATDHLTGSNVVTNSSGTIEELTDYYPYGEIRLDEKTGAFSEQRKFTGYEYDGDTGLNYAGSRYYEASTGRFISQDPAYLATGDRNAIKLKTGQSLESYLSDPQAMNSYSYARNNPLVVVDKTGNYIETAFDMAMFSLSLNDYREKPGFWNGVSVIADGASLFLPIPAIVGAVRHGDEAAKLLRVAADKAGDVGRLAEKASGSKSVFTRAAEHSVNDHNDIGHYAGKSIQEVENIAKNTYNNFDIKVNIKDVKKYFYNSKTNDLFINNPKGPTIFQPKDGLDYLKRTVSDDIKKGGRVK